MAKRKKKFGKWLPPNCSFKHGGFHYHPSVDGKRKSKMLSRDYQEFLSIYAKLTTVNDGQIETMTELFDRYVREIIPHKKKATQRHELYNLKRLKKAFVKFRIGEIKPIHIREYRDLRGQTSKTQANHEIATLSNVCGWGIEWGSLETNPCAGIKKNKLKKRTRKVENWELQIFIKHAPLKESVVFELADLVAFRPIDNLKVKKTDFDDIGYHTTINKTGELVYYPWTDGLKVWYARALEAQKNKDSDYLFCNRKGNPYTVDGFGNNVRKTIKKLLHTGLIKESFSLRDIRPKAASEEAFEKGMNAAQSLLDHSSQSTTKKYVRTEKMIMPRR